MHPSQETHVLTIQGGLTRVEKTIVEREVKTADFLREIALQQPLDSGLLPAGCVRFARCRDAQERDRILYVLHRPAGLQEIRFNPGRPRADEAQVVNYALAWPATLWFVRCAGAGIEDVHVACVPDGRQTLEDRTPLRRLLMPNLYEYGHGAVCLGDLTLEGDAPLGFRAGRIVEEILASRWNDDLMPDFDGSGIDSLVDWAARSAADPQAHTAIRFPEHRHPTLGAMLAALLGEPSTHGRA